MKTSMTKSQIVQCIVMGDSPGQRRVRGSRLWKRFHNSVPHARKAETNWARKHT